MRQPKLNPRLTMIVYWDINIGAKGYCCIRLMACHLGWGWCTHSPQSQRGGVLKT